VTDSWDTIDRLLEEMIGQAEAKVLSIARRLVPGVTAEDVRNPHDFPALARDSRFNYEDGILAGLRSAQTAVRAERRMLSLPGGQSDCGSG
jgi:hypothetical protein